MYNSVAGSNKIFFIQKSQVSQDQKVTYGRIVRDIRPHKDVTHRTKITVGGNIIDYPGEVTANTSDIIRGKTLINSTISTPDARFLCTDIANLYFNTTMYIQLPFDILPQDIFNEYNLTKLSHNRKFYIDI